MSREIYSVIPYLFSLHTCGVDRGIDHAIVFHYAIGRFSHVSDYSEIKTDFWRCEILAFLQRIPFFRIVYLQDGFYKSRFPRGPIVGPKCSDRKSVVEGKKVKNN
jgi:hypothetical protein